MKLDLGCGVNRPEGFIGIDTLPTADVIHDLRNGIPYHDNSIDVIRAKDFFEHMPDLIFIFNECWRVLKFKGELIVEVPRFPHVDSVKDPTHASFFAVETFTEYFCGPDRLEQEYGMKMWTSTAFDVEDHRIWATLIPRGK